MELSEGAWHRPGVVEDTLVVRPHRFFFSLFTFYLFLFYFRPFPFSSFSFVLFLFFSVSALVELHTHPRQRYFSFLTC